MGSVEFGVNLKFNNADRIEQDKYSYSLWNGYCIMQRQMTMLGWIARACAAGIAVSGWIPQAIHAGTLEATCRFKQTRMPCAVTITEGWMRVKWDDGVSDTYREDGGWFIDSRGGAWRFIQRPYNIDLENEYGEVIQICIAYKHVCMQ